MEKTKWIEIPLDLLQSAVDFANQEYDGHLTIMKFTTGWKILFGTPTMDNDQRVMLDDLPSKMTLAEAIGVINELNRSF